MAGSLSNQQVTGIVFIVIGVIALAGWLNSLIILVAGVALLVYGILILLGKARGTQLVGILCIIAGIILLLGYVPFLSAIVKIATLVIGIILIVLGILKLMGK